MLLTGLEGSWWPDRIVTPGLELAGGVLIVAALVAARLGVSEFDRERDRDLHDLACGTRRRAARQHRARSQLARSDPRREDRGLAIPFEALYQDALRAITEKTSGLTGFLLRLGPFGGAEQGGLGLRLWAVAYLVLVGAIAVAGFARRDL